MPSLISRHAVGGFIDDPAGRCGRKAGIISVAHRILIAIYHMLKKHEPYKDMGANLLDERNKPKVVSRTKRLVERAWLSRDD